MGDSTVQWGEVLGGSWGISTAIPRTSGQAGRSCIGGVIRKYRFLGPETGPLSWACGQGSTSSQMTGQPVFLSCL